MISEGKPKRRRRGILTALAVAAVMAGLLWRPASHAGRSGPGAETRGAPVKTGPRPSVGPDELLVVIAKGKRQLTVFRGDTEIRSFPVVLGSRTDGDKVRQGDGRTPVGTFYVCEKNEKSKYYLFVGLSYPNAEDAERGLRDGLITREEHDQIVQANAEHRKPPWYTKLGGEIGLHGGGTAWDWTRGCVGLDNGDMRELYALMPMGTPVIIEP